MEKIMIFLILYETLNQLQKIRSFEMQGLMLIKLGGSVVTFKDKPLTPNVDAIGGISHVLNQLKAPLVIVHGGGSFGHYWSVQYDMHTKPDSYDARGISVVHESMVALNQIVVNSMLQEELHPLSLPPSVFTNAGHKPMLAKIKQIGTMAKSGVTPVTFGDVVHVHSTKYSILSGDAIMTLLAKVLRPAKVIFATNVDGIYKDMYNKELLHEITVAGKKSVQFSHTAGEDITGGMQRKVTEAFKIASFGIDVFMVNGLVPMRIREAALGALKVGTVIKRR
jgi:isopentenyl phosphate kinase